MTTKAVESIRQIRGLFSDFPMYEAIMPIPMPVSAGLCEVATPNSLNNCPIAWCVKVTQSADIVPFILRSTAYLVNRQTKTITRYLIPAKTRAMIRHYDTTGEFIPGEYWLIPPPVSQRLGAKPTGKQTRVPQYGTRRPALEPRTVTF